MIPRPYVVGLSLCDQILVDQSSRKPSVIGVFTGLGVEQFPSDAQRFSVFATLMEGLGEGTIEVRAIQLKTGDRIYSQQGKIYFPDRLIPVNAIFRVRGVRFPSSGLYLFEILVDAEVIENTSRRLNVYQMGDAG